MAYIAYHASHEQFSPSELLHYTILAEKAGFNAIHSSDHFKPWSETQGHSGHSFSWLGAAMQAVNLPFGLVCAPGQRYHPAIIAQAAATLCEMFPERLWLALGSGENLNESITGDPWPAKQVRNDRLKECYDIISRMLRGETVDHDGPVRVRKAKLYSKPAVAPPLLGAAISEETARWMSTWAEGLLTAYAGTEERRRVRNAFLSGGNDKPVYIKVQLSYDESDELALEGAFEQWKYNVLPSELLANLADTEDFESAAKDVRPEQVTDKVLVSADTTRYAEWIEELLDEGYDAIILHNVNRKQEKFIHDFGKQVLSRLKKRLKAN